MLQWPRQKKSAAVRGFCSAAVAEDKRKVLQCEGLVLQCSSGEAKRSVLRCEGSAVLQSRTEHGRPRPQDGEAPAGAGSTAGTAAPQHRSTFSLKDNPCS